MKIGSTQNSIIYASDQGHVTVIRREHVAAITCFPIEDEVMPVEFHFSNGTKTRVSVEGITDDLVKLRDSLVCWLEKDVPEVWV